MYALFFAFLTWHDYIKNNTDNNYHSKIYFKFHPAQSIYFNTQRIPRIIHELSGKKQFTMLIINSFVDVRQSLKFRD